MKIPDKRRHLELKLSNCRGLLEELQELSIWMTSTKHLLETQQGPVGSATSNDEHDSIVVDPKVNKCCTQIYIKAVSIIHSVSV